MTEGIPDKTAVALLEAVMNRDFSHWKEEKGFNTLARFGIGLGMGFTVNANVDAGWSNKVDYSFYRDGDDWTLYHHSDQPTPGPEGIRFPGKSGCLDVRFGDGFDYQAIAKGLGERESPGPVPYGKNGHWKLYAVMPNGDYGGSRKRPVPSGAKAPGTLCRAVMFQDLSGLGDTITAGPLKFVFGVPKGADYCSQVKVDVEGADGPFSFSMSGVLTYGYGCVVVRGLQSDCSLAADLDTDADEVYLTEHPVPVWGCRE